jgi:hypothetical protein
MIVDDFPAIAHRMAQIAKERQREVFSIPAGIVIIPRRKLAAFSRLPLCDLCFVLDDRVCCLSLIADGSRSSLRHPVGMRFIEHLTRFYSSVRMVNAFEARLSPEDVERLLRHLEGQ